MNITEITVRIGATESLGDYNNCRPEITLRAELNHGQSVAGHVDQLIGEARKRVHAIIDDELELAGQSPKYHRGPLYEVRRSSARRCIIVARSGISLPVESNWKMDERWLIETRNPCRLGTAQSLAQRLLDNHPDHDFVTIHKEEPIASLPPLPDPGPEPEWSQKSLTRKLQNLDIPEEYWTEIGELQHVDTYYLQNLYMENLEHEPLSTRLDIIRNDRPWPPENERPWPPENESQLDF